MNEELEFSLIISDVEPLRMNVNWTRGVQRVLAFNGLRFIALRAVSHHKDVGTIAMIDHASWYLLAEETNESLSDLQFLYLAPRNWMLLEA
jgi:hypothetical protein